MTKYLVIATAWLNEKPVRLVVGEFTEVAHAYIFKKAYEKANSTTAFITEIKEEY